LAERGAGCLKLSHSLAETSFSFPLQVGAGVLSLPYAFEHTGWAGGLLLIGEVLEALATMAGESFKAQSFLRVL
jgi:hypothetical protein